MNCTVFQAYDPYETSVKYALTKLDFEICTRIQQTEILSAM